MSKSKPIVLLALLLGACQTEIVQPDDNDAPPPENGGDNTPSPGPVDPPPTTQPPPPPPSTPGPGTPATPPAVDQPDPVPDLPPQWVRGNLRPIYELTPLNLFGDFDRGDFSIANADFQVAPGLQVNVSHAQKMNEIQQDVLPPARTGSPQIISAANDNTMAQQIPFRGKPSDVKFLIVNGITKVYVPLGGNIMAPGNEVSVVDLNSEGVPLGRPELVTVGLRPQRVTVHPANLIFVCNQYSNYISVIDPTTDEVLRFQGRDVEVETQYYCSDIVFTPKNVFDLNDVDEQTMFVSNRWRHSVLQYDVEIERDPITNDPINVRSQFVKEITDVGVNPYRMTVSDQQNQVFVVSNKGGQVASINVQTGQTRVVSLNAPTGDVVNIENKLFIPTTMPNRGQVTDAAGALVPQELLADPVRVTGMDGQQHIVHPGSFTDDTESYLFEDAASGLFDISTALNNPVYYTDNSSGEPNFQGFQKIIDGGLPWAVTRNARGDRIWVTMSGSRQVQEFAVVAAAQQSLSPLRTLNTNHRPLGVALDEVNNLLYVSNYMGETLDVFDLADVNAVDPIQRIDLGYAVPLFPATNMEVGELFFNDTDISNDGDKSCVSCHYDELDLDGIGFANGTGTPTGYKQIKPQHNLARTGPWFWNGGMGNGNYTSTAYSFQTRTNCDMIQFAFVEGPSSNPATRIGDPFNFTEASNVAQELQDNPLFAQLVDPADVAALNDAACRPENVVQGIPANAAEIAAQNNIQKRIVAALIQARSLEVMGEEAAANLGFPQGVERQELAFFVDLYSNGEIRLPPNPLQQMRINNQLSTAQAARLDQGEQLFASSGCAFCHNPNDQFIDRRNHGPGNDWLERFEQEFRNDPSILAIGGFQQPFLQSLANNVPDQTVNVHIDPIESFTPICPVVDSCLRFFDPIQANGAERQRRLDLQIAVNLDDDERQFLPSNPPGLPSVNTPTLRGTWSRGPGLMHHTHAKNVAQAILPPGHSYLKPGEVGYNATTTNGVYDVHGATSRLNDDQARALIEYVNSIE